MTYTAAHRKLLCEIIDADADIARGIRDCEYDGNPNMIRSLEAIADFEKRATAELIEALRNLCDGVANGSVGTEFLTARALLAKIDGEQP